MISTQTADVSLPAHRPWPGIGLIHFLRRELAPFPGRALATARVVIACVIVVILCMTLRVPEAFLSVWMVTRIAMEDSSQTLLAGIVFLVALTIAIALALLLLIVAMDQPALRFCLMGGLAAAGLFLRRTFLIGAAGFVIGLIGFMIMTVPDFVPVPELVIRASLWLWSVFALGIAAAVAANLLIAPSDPEAVLRAEIVTRLRATEDSLRRWGWQQRDAEVRRLAAAGITRLLALLKSAAFAHASVRVQHAQYSTLITLVDRLVTAAATAVELQSATTPSVEERERLREVADDCARLRRRFEARQVAERAQRRAEHRSSGGRVSAVLPVIVELEHTVDLVEQTLAAQGEHTAAAASSHEGVRLFVPDAFTNPAYVRYALKGTLAVMLCYVLQTAVDWPGIRTCIVTCLIVGLTSEGASIQKGTLRISGALVGAAMGFLSILFFVPHMESITSLVILVAAGTAIAAWVVVGSPRISYAGVQIAFAFYVCVIQGFGPTWYFYTIRDRIVGILLGNVVITLVFHYIWPVRASAAMWTSLRSALRAMAELATAASRSGAQPIVAGQTEDLRLRASHDFLVAQQLADEAAFELSDRVPEQPTTSLGAYQRLQRVTADAQSVFLTQLALAQQRSTVAPPHLPDVLVNGMRHFDAVVAENLAVIADPGRRGETALPDLRTPLATVTDLMQQTRTAASLEATAQLGARLALYRELVPRIERLGLAELE